MVTLHSSTWELNLTSNFLLHCFLFYYFFLPPIYLYAGVFEVLNAIIIETMIIGLVDQGAAARGLLL